MPTPLSLRTQLLMLVGGPLFLLVLVETIASYRIGLHAADVVFDRWLFDSVMSVAQEVHYRDSEIHFDADRTAIEVIEWDDLDEVYYQVITPERRLIAGTPVLEPVRDLDRLSTGPVFEDIQIAGAKARSVSLLLFENTAYPVIVTVAETVNKRPALTGDLLAEVLISKGVLLMAVMLTISAAFNRGLRPLSLLSGELQQRSPQDLTPIGLGRVPLELHGLVENTNRLLSRLDTALTSREQFIGNIAHQIRTPLAGMKLQAQLAQDEQDPAVIQLALGRISHAADQMAHVNSQLMKLARAETAFGRGLRQEDVDLATVARNCCAALAPRAIERGIHLVLQVPDSPVTVPGEAILLGEMIRNLIENAILYGYEEGHVRVRLTQHTEDSPELVVEDDGPGIAPEHWPNIFDRFYRPSQTTGEGCGLGLSIVREIALAHNAMVRLETTDSGKGTRFVVRFDATVNQVPA